MKCPSCGAINSASLKECEFCSAELQPQTGPAGEALPLPAQVSFAQDALNLFGELNSAKSSGFNFLAFLFPIAFLFGYGAKETAKKLGLIILLPVVVEGILSRASLMLSIVLGYAVLGWVIYLSVLVATRTPSLVKKDNKFDMGQAVLAQFVYFVAYFIASLV